MGRYIIVVKCMGKVMAKNSHSLNSYPNDLVCGEREDLIDNKG